MAALVKGAKVLLIDTPGKVMENTGETVQHVTKGVERLAKTGEYATEGAAAVVETAKELLQSTAAFSSFVKAQFEKRKVASEGRLAIMSSQQTAKNAEAEKVADEKVKQAQSEMEKNKLKLQSEMLSLNDPTVKEGLAKALITTEKTKHVRSEMEARAELEKLAATDKIKQQKLYGIDQRYAATQRKNLKCQQIGFEYIYRNGNYRLCNYAPLSFGKNDYYCINKLTIGGKIINVIAKFGILPTESQGEYTSEPVVESVAEPVAEPVVESVAEPVAEPVVESVAEPVVESVAEPVAEPEPVTGGNTPSEEKQWYYHFVLEGKTKIIDNKKLSEAFSNYYKQGAPLLIDDLNVDSVSFAKCGTYDNTNYEKEYKKITDRKITGGGKRTRKAKKNRTVKKNKKIRTKKR
jgi:hypothetical protein